jgi:hypothetical protein
MELVSVVEWINVWVNIKLLSYYRRYTSESATCTAIVGIGLNVELYPIGTML